MGHAYLRFAEEHPGHYQVLFRTAAPAGITEGSAEHPEAPGFFILVESVQRFWTQGCGRQVGGTPRSWPSRCGSFSTASSTCASFSSFLSPWPPSEALLDAALADLGLGARGEGRERNR
jgi:hypothetical protein